MNIPCRFHEVVLSDRYLFIVMFGITTAKSALLEITTGWYPELVFLTVVFFNSTVSAVLIPNTSVFDTLFILQ